MKYIYCREKRKLIWFTVIWFLFMMFLSHQPGPDTAKTSSGISLLIAQLLALDSHEVHGFIRHMAHVVLYLVLAVSLGTLLRHSCYSWTMILGVLVIVAVLDEATKPLIAGRHCDIEDIGLNCVGNFFGAAYLLLRRVLLYEG